MNVDKNAPSRPALRYHGGKWRLAPWIVSYFPKHRVYVELFGGGGSVLLRKERSYAEIYNDIDGEVVNVFRILQDQNTSRELCRRIYLTPFAREEFSLSYQPAKDAIEKARKTIIRSFMGFGSDGVNGARNTGFRANSNRSGTTPAHDWANYPDVIATFTERLRGVVIENRDWEEVINQHDTNRTLIYADPPYLHNTRTNSKRYRFEFMDKDHIQLAEKLNKVEGMVIVSGYPSALYSELYTGWKVIERKAWADGALERVEMLWLSPRTWDALQSGAGLPLFKNL